MDKKTCEKCGQRVKSLRKRKRKLICWKCYTKDVTIIQIREGYKNLEEALNTVYCVGRRGGNKFSGGVCNFPKALIGRKIRVVLVE